MIQADKNPWTEVAGAFTLLHPELRTLNSKALPQSDACSEYAVDLAIFCSEIINENNFQIKGLSRFKENKRWNSLKFPLFYAIALSQLSLVSKNGDLLSPTNASYITRQLELTMSGLGSLVLSTGNDSSPVSIDPLKIFAKSIRLLDTAVEISHLGYKSGSEMERIDILVREVGDLFARIKHVSNELYFEVLQGDFVSPLRRSPTSFPQPPNNAFEGSVIEDEQINNSQNFVGIDGLNHSFDFKRLALGSARDEYPSWVSHCQNIGRLQRMPERLFMDLIPPLEIANHTIKNVFEWQKFLEKQIPGRSKWLVSEGVSDKDFVQFWAQPAWVQNFIEKLMSRNLQLECQAHIDRGEDIDSAREIAVAFIPMYGNIPPTDEDIPFRQLPIELFDRVRLHLAITNHENVQSEMISNDCFFINDYVRRRIKNGLL
jgi:hypothetical protein